MIEYKKLILGVQSKGRNCYDERTGVGTIRTFSTYTEYDLNLQFPILELRKLHWKSILNETIFFLKGLTNNNWLVERGTTIWNEWANEDGELGPIYGKQWRDWVGVDGKRHDQLKDVIERIKTNPSDRRLVVSAWNVGELDQMALPPCHMFFQFYVEGGKLSCQLYQRSADVVLGVPFNIASYALLTHIVAYVCDLKVNRFIHVTGDTHIYLNHLDGLKELMSRPVRLDYPIKPRLVIAPDTPKDIDLIDVEHFKLINYRPQPSIKFDVAV